MEENLGAAISCFPSVLSSGTIRALPLLLSSLPICPHKLTWAPQGIHTWP